MGYASIAIGLGLGGGKSATSNGRLNVASETFTTATLSTTDSYALSVNNTYTLTVRPSAVIGAGDSISIVGLTSSTTSDNGSLTVAGTNAAVFGSSGAWTQSSGTLVLTVAGGQSIPTGSDTVITFVLANPSSVTGGVSSVTLTSSGFSASNLTGTFLKGVATYNVTTRDTEANITASTPSNPSGEVTNAYGTDTNNLYVYDGSTWYIYKNFNDYSVSFDATDDYLDIGTVSALNSTTSFTISMWINFEYVTGGVVMSTFTSGTATNNRIEFVFNNINELRFGVDGSVNNCKLNISSPTDYRSTNAWHNIVGTYDGTNVTLFFDGSQVSTTTLSVPSTTSSTQGNDTTVGRRTLGGGNLYFNGLIDEVAIWDSVLSTSDITTIYSNGTPSNISYLSPVGWWRMGDNDGGTGTTITDQGSGGNNGTLTNGPTFSTNVP